MTDLDLILTAAREAGALALSAREGGLKIWSKDGGSPVTDADLAVDTLLKDRLGAARPDYGWLSEETADAPARLATPRQFVVDPIDGTVAFMKGKPWFAVSIAVVENGRPGGRRGPRPRPGRDLRRHPGRRRVPERRGRSAPATPTTWRTPPCWATPRCSPIRPGRARGRRCGWRAATRSPIACAWWPAGAFDAAVALSPKNEWDLAAADLICAEAGAVLTDHTGRAFTYNRPNPLLPSVVCANRALHPLILSRVGHIDLPQR
jgi:myo-inositol-1(or 4)-monophosphatase